MLTFAALGVQTPRMPETVPASGPLATAPGALDAAAVRPVEGSGFSGKAGADAAEGGLGDALAQEKAQAKVMQDKLAQACQTCKNRMYQDGSNDPGVSFKSPAHIDPANAASVVMAHEQEHVAHEQAKARAEGGKVLYQSVVLHTGICPECGRTYVAGGTTHTVSRPGGAKVADFAAGLVGEAEAGQSLNGVA